MKNRTLKRAILEGVREDNLRLDDPRRPPLKQLLRTPPPKPRAPKKIVGLTLVAVIGLIVFLSVSVFKLPLTASKLPPKMDASEQSAYNALLARSNLSVAYKETWESLSIDKYRASIRPLTMDLEPTPAFSIDSGDYDILVNNADVRLTTLFGLGVRTIVIDPGHGGKDSGAVGVQGTKEKEITLDVAHRLKNLLEKNSTLAIHLTRKTDNTVSLSDRVHFTNTVGADLFVSIHVNSIPEPDINTIETYYFGPPSDEKTLRLAARENADSMYSSTDFKKLIQKIGNTIKQQESIALARNIQRRLFANIKKYDKDVHNWGVKVAPFMVLLDVESPAVLTEISCISEPEEEKKLNTTEYREKIASFIEKGIIAYLTQKQIQAQRGEKNESKKNG